MFLTSFVIYTVAREATNNCKKSAKETSNANTIRFDWQCHFFLSKVFQLLREEFKTQIIAFDKQRQEWSEKKSGKFREEIFSFYRIFISYSCAFPHVIFGHSMKFRLISVPTRRSFAPWKCILNQPKHIYMNPLCAFSTEWLLLSIGNQTQAKTRCSDEWKQAWIDR